MNEKYLLHIKSPSGRKQLRSFSDDRVSIGSSKFSGLHIPNISSNSGVHSIIQNNNGNHIITCINPQANLTVNGKKVLSHKLNNNDKINIFDFELEYIAPSKLCKVRKLKEVCQNIEYIDTDEMDQKIKKGFIAFIVFAFIFLITISFIDIPDEVEIEDIPDRFSRLIFDPDSLNIMKPDGDGEGVGIRAADQEGERGDKTKRKISKSLRAIVKKKGVLGALNAKRVRRQLSKILDAGLGFGSKFDKAMRSRANKASKRALYKGAFGSGMKGIGGGGGGKSKDVIGGLSTKGKGGGVQGFGKGTVGKRARSRIMVEEEDTIVKGALEKAEIMKVINDHMPQIRYCYERELNTTPDLAGKVVTFFVIGGDGSVQMTNISGSTLKSSAVETCITRRITRWIFPKPRGGGIVQVEYPFLFNHL